METAVTNSPMPDMIIAVLALAPSSLDALLASRAWICRQQKQRQQQAPGDTGTQGAKGADPHGAGSRMSVQGRRVMVAAAGSAPQCRGAALAAPVPQTAVCGTTATECSVPPWTARFRPIPATPTGPPSGQASDRGHRLHIPPQHGGTHPAAQQIQDAGQSPEGLRTLAGGGRSRRAAGARHCRNRSCTASAAPAAAH